MICCDSCGHSINDLKVDVHAKQRHVRGNTITEFMFVDGVTKEYDLELCPACWDSVITFLKNRIKREE